MNPPHEKPRSSTRGHRGRDCNHDKPWHFIVLWTGIALVLVLGLLLIARLVLYFVVG